MQEEVESRTLTLIVNSSKFTGRTVSIWRTARR